MTLAGRKLDANARIAHSIAPLLLWRSTQCFQVPTSCSIYRQCSNRSQSMFLGTFQEEKLHVRVRDAHRRTV